MASRIENTELFHLFHVHEVTRTIYVGSEEVSISEGESGVDERMAERLMKNLHVLAAKNSDPITVYLSTFGGDVYSSFAMYDAIRLCPTHVTVRVYGKAMSAGTFILQAADHRVATASSRLMIHHGTLYIGESTHTGLEDELRESKALNAVYESVYLERMRASNPSVTEKRLKQLLSRDTYLSAHEALTLGLIDEVV